MDIPLYNNGYSVKESMISLVLKSPVNGEYSFVIMGDCFKSGSDLSKEYALHRGLWASRELHNVRNVVIVNFGEDDPVAFCEEISQY